MIREKDCNSEFINRAVISIINGRSKRIREEDCNSEYINRAVISIINGWNKSIGEKGYKTEFNDTADKYKVNRMKNP